MTSDLLEKQSQSDELSQYLTEIRQYPRLTPEEELELAARCAQEDMDAIRKMVNSNLRLVVSIAREYAGRGVPLLDLVQEGSIGLLAAARRFDHRLEYRFSTYATKWIRQGITRCLQNHGMIRVPAHTAERIRRVAAARAAFQQEYGTEPTEKQLSALCGLTEDKIRQLQQLEPQVCSLDTPVGDGEDELSLLLENIQAEQPYEELVRQELDQTLGELMDSLDPRQQLVLRLHYGLEDGVCRSYEQIAQQLGVSKERARQIEKQAMRQLQKRGSAVGLEEFLE